VHGCSTKFQTFIKVICYLIYASKEHQIFQEAHYFIGERKEREKKKEKEKKNEKRTVQI